MHKNYSRSKFSGTHAIYRLSMFQFVKQTLVRLPKFDFQSVPYYEHSVYSVTNTYYQYATFYIYILFKHDQNDRKHNFDFEDEMRIIDLYVTKY